jgi:hypothetical protein
MTTLNLYFIFQTATRCMGEPWFHLDKPMSTLRQIGKYCPPDAAHICLFAAALPPLPHNQSGKTWSWVAIFYKSIATGSTFESLSKQWMVAIRPSFAAKAGMLIA